MWWCIAEAAQQYGMGMRRSENQSADWPPPHADEESVLVRGAVSVASDPTVVFWNGQHVPLSRVEGEVYAYVFRRGRVHVSEIDALMTSIDAKPETRSLVLGHIRGKFARLGACNPFERLGKELIRLRVDADPNGRTAPVIGLTSLRYVRVSSPDK
jgi:hypothetical protein